MQNINSYHKNIFEWSEFFTDFRDHQSDFIKRLTDSHPTLTSMEFKLCCLLHAGFSNNEIADFTNKSLRSIETARYRLRKKLPISTHDDLGVFLMKF